MTRAVERLTRPYHSNTASAQSEVSAVTAIQRAMSNQEPHLKAIFADSNFGSEVVDAALSHTFATTRFWAAASMTSQTDKLRKLRASDPYGMYPEDVRRGMEGSLDETLEDAEFSDSRDLPVLDLSILFVATTALALERYQEEDDSRALEAHDVIVSSLPQAWEAAGQPGMPALILNHVIEHPELLQ